MGLMSFLVWCSTSDLPNFFASTKFFACLDLLESKELFEATEMVRYPSHTPAYSLGLRPALIVVIEWPRKEHDSTCLSLNTRATNLYQVELWSTGAACQQCRVHVDTSCQ